MGTVEDWRKGMEAMSTLTKAENEDSVASLTTISVRIQVNGVDYIHKRGILAAIIRDLATGAAMELEFSSLVSGQFSFDKTVTVEDNA